MHTIIFYEDEKGNKPVLEYLEQLAKTNGKENRVRLKKAQDYINVLKTYGNTIGEPYMKHLDGGIWELRPLRNRILFFYWDGNSFILLSHFIKKTQKTPKKEIEKAKRLMNDYIERSKNDE